MNAFSSQPIEVDVEGKVGKPVFFRWDGKEYRIREIWAEWWMLALALCCLVAGGGGSAVAARIHIGECESAATAGMSFPREQGFVG